MLVAAPRHPRRVSAGSAPSGVALPQRERQGCRRRAQVVGEKDLVSRIAFHIKGARRASICSPMSGDIGVDAVDPAKHVREQESVMVGEMPVERSAQLI